MGTDEKVYGWDSPIERPDGVTSAERNLKRLCDRSFLSLWSHAGVYRDQGKRGENGHGKELCDLLVVFENHILIFSDKDCKFPDTGDLALDWCRWYRKAIEKSADQVYGAERWIRRFPDHIFLDRACKHRFPIELPPLDMAKFHRIVVAHDSAHRCRKELGGSGSLMIVPSIVGTDHRNQTYDRFTPFAVGRIDPTRGFLHVFDDTTLDIVMKARDTISDFVEYLESKEALIESDRLAFAAGEEDLLACFLREFSPTGKHTFLIPSGYDLLAVQEGEWRDFVRSPKRKAQLAEDRGSYLWDYLVEKFTKHFIEGTADYCTHATYAEQEQALRYFAREPRFRRRVLSQAFRELVENGSQAERGTRIAKPMKHDDPYYVYLTLRPSSHVPYETYRKRRRDLLAALCKITKFMFPEAENIVGLATEPGIKNELRSEDALYYDASIWSQELEDESRNLQQVTGFLTRTNTIERYVSEYPETLPQSSLKRKRSSQSQRNSNCPCGSGKKFKKCCGR